MSHPVIRTFIQARMSSRRFPGKVLAPLNGRPIIAHVISQVAQAIPSERITIVTSTEESDDPLVCYVEKLGISVCRGPLHDVFSRFQLCLEEHHCSWFFRICSDSPLLNSNMISAMLKFTERADVDLVTNVQVRTFPVGHSVEMINSGTFAGIDGSQLTDEEKEHVTKVYYRHPSDYRIINIEGADPGLAGMSLAVDTLEDLCRLERISSLDGG